MQNMLDLEIKSFNLSYLSSILSDIALFFHLVFQSVNLWTILSIDFPMCPLSIHSVVYLQIRCIMYKNCWDRWLAWFLPPLRM